MEIFETDGDISNIGKNITSNDVNDIVTDGITIISGNRVIKFAVTDETALPEDALKDDYNKSLEIKISELQNQFVEERGTLRQAYNLKYEELEKKLREVEDLKKEISPMPVVDYEFSTKGLSVSKYNGDYVWSYKCVYAPKYINDDLIDPVFAKRLLTPITIEIFASDGKCSNVRVMSIIGNKKFQHYHSLSRSTDCWGNFGYSGEDVSTQEKAYELAIKALVVLESVNKYSIGTRNPKGLSRFNTLEKHILEKGAEVDEEKTKANTRNTRTGIDTNTNDDINDSVWTTT